MNNINPKVRGALKRRMTIRAGNRLGPYASLVLIGILLAGCLATERGITHRPETNTMRVAIRFGNVVPFKELRQRLSAEIQRTSNGSLQVKYLDFEKLFPVQDNFDAVSQGRVEAAISVGAMWRKREAAFGILSGAPFGLPPKQHLAWLTQPDVIRFHDNLYAKYNLRSLPYAVIGPEGDISVVPISSLSDFRMMTWLLPGYARHVAKDLGVKLVDIPASKAKRALRTGEIHGTDYSIPETDLYANFFDLAKYYYYPSWSQPSMTMELIVNLNFLNGLTPEQRLALETACRTTALWWHRQNERRTQEALSKIRAKGVTVQPWPNDIVEVASSVWARQLTEDAKGDPRVGQVVALLDRFRAQPSSEPYLAVASAQATTSPVPATAPPTTDFKGSKVIESETTPKVPPPPEPPTAVPTAPPPPAPTPASSTATPKAYQPRLFVLAIGVSRYKDSNLNLNFASVDAQAVADALKSQSDRVYKEIRVQVLTDEKATRTEILRAMGTFLGRAVSSDVVVIFVAGHGVKKEDTGSFFFLPHLANVNNLLDQGLSWYGFEEAVNTLKQRVQNIVLILDTCHAGAMQLSMRGLRGGQDLSRPFARKGYYALAAAYPDESAAENDQWGHGAFTYAILEGLRGRADVNKDDLIDVLELFHYVESRVADLTGGLQHPHFHMGGGSLPLTALH